MLNATKVESNFSKFLKGYRAVRNMQSGIIWPTGNVEYFCGSISYQKGGEQVTKKVGWDNVYELAEKKLKNKITNIQIKPEEKGKIAAAIYRSLKIALNPNVKDSEAKIYQFSEAVSGMYLMNLTENKTFLKKMYDKFKLTKKQWLGPPIFVNWRLIDKANELFSEFGLLEKKEGEWNSHEKCYQRIERILGINDKEPITKAQSLKHLICQYFKR